jgi:hypothetical protein
MPTDPTDYRARRRPAAALLAAACAAVCFAGVLVGCDNGASSNPGATTTPAADRGQNADQSQSANTADNTSASGENADSDTAAMTAAERLKRASQAREEDLRRKQEERLADFQRVQQAAASVPGDTQQQTPLRTPEETTRPDGPNQNVALEFETRTIDLGTLYSPEPVSFEFPFTNMGTDDLVITAVRATCGCTTTNTRDILNRPIAPGETGSIKARFTPPNDGPTSKAITVKSNDRLGRDIVLEIKANYVPPARITPQRQLRLPTVGVEEGLSGEFFIEMRDESSEIERIDISSVRGETGDTFNATVEPVESETEGFPHRVRVKLDTVERPRTGPLNERVMVTVAYNDHESGERRTTDLLLMLSGALKSQLALVDNPQGWAFRIPTIALSEPFTHTQRIMLRSGEPFNIDRVELGEVRGLVTDVEATVAPVEEEGVEPNTMWEITIAGNGPAQPSSFQSQITIFHDLENEGPTMIRFSGGAAGDGSVPRGGTPIDPNEIKTSR